MQIHSLASVTFFKILIIIELKSSKSKFNSLWKAAKSKLMAIIVLN